MQIIETLITTDWNKEFTPADQAYATRAIEEGKVIFMPELSFKLSEHEKRYLSAKYVDPKTKNISYDHRKQTLRGAIGTPEECEQLKSLVARFCLQANQLVTQLFPEYQGAIQLARTSFRPAEVSQRKMSYRKDDKRLHVDAFPANPNQGKRILRVFSNVNPAEDRVWRLGESFENVARRFLPTIKPPLPLSAKLLQLLKITKSRRTEYDHIMLYLHDTMKADENYQRNAEQIEFHFPPHTSWIVQTDIVSHAAMSGQYLLEQTFYLPVDAMQEPQRSPLKILERLIGHTLV